MKRLVAIILMLILTISLCPALAEYTDSETILAVQQALADLGIYKGNISGVKGNATEAAIRTYQQKNDLKSTGQIDDDLLDSLGLLSGEVVLISNIILSEESVSLSKGGNATLTATVEPRNARNKKVEWSSTDETIATVKDGKVTAKANGTCDIICRALDDSGVEAVCHVAVIVMVTSVTTTLNQKVTIPYGGSVELSATAKPADATNTTLKWSSSDESVCVIDENGKVTSVGSGDCEIECSATDGSKKSLKFQIHVPIFDTLEATYTITEKGWNLIPIDLHGASAGNISHSVSSEKFFMYYFDNEGIHVYPIAEGNAIITLTNKLNKQDKMAVSVNIERSATYVNEEEPLNVIVTLDQSKIELDDTFNVCYRITGGKPPYSIQYVANGMRGSTPAKGLSSPSGKFSLHPEYFTSYETISITAIDSTGAICTGTSNAVQVDLLDFVTDYDYLAVKRNIPIDIAYSITSGSGQYKLDIQWSWVDNGRSVLYGSESINTDSTGAIHLVTPPNGDTLTFSVTVIDRANKANQFSNSFYMMLTEDWSAKVKYNHDVYKAGEEVAVTLFYESDNQSDLPVLIIDEWDFKTNGIYSSIADLPSQYPHLEWTQEANNVYVASYIPSSCKSINMYYRFRNLGTFIYGRRIILH